MRLEMASWRSWSAAARPSDPKTSSISSRVRPFVSGTYANKQASDNVQLPGMYTREGWRRTKKRMNNPPRKEKAPKKTNVPNPMWVSIDGVTCPTRRKTVQEPRNASEDVRYLPMKLFI